MLRHLIKPSHRLQNCSAQYFLLHLGNLLGVYANMRLSGAIASFVNQMVIFELKEKPTAWLTVDKASIISFVKDVNHLVINLYNLTY